jgi:hypothetical protein
MQQLKSSAKKKTSNRLDFGDNFSDVGWSTASAVHLGAGIENGFSR